jgi:hypothetical protein
MLPSHRRAITDILACRTEALGGHLWRCDACSAEVYSYHSCKNTGHRRVSRGEYAFGISSERLGETAGGRRLMFLVALLNCLLGTICGLWFRATIIVPLLAVALIEVAILKHIGEWSSAFWLTIVLITMRT